MAVLPILRWPDACLSERCASVGGGDVAELVGDLFETMYAAPGRGLAAPQVGVLLRVFVMDVGWKDGEMTPRACIDPVIAWRSDKTATFDEGCLSIPGIVAPVTRPARITLRYRSLDGVSHEDTLQGMEAVCAQHELDHLDGIVTFDRVDADTRAALLNAYGDAA